MRSRYLLSALALVLVMGAATTATAQRQTVVYNSIPQPLPGNVASVDSWGLEGVGDGLNLAASGGTIGKVTVVLSSWACQSGTWVSGCTTTPGATFDWPITISIYGATYGSVSPSFDTPAPTSATSLGTITKTFAIPYRPSATPSLCPGALYAPWYDFRDKICYNGFAVPVSVDFSTYGIAIPANSRIIVTAAYNTSLFGPEPVGTSNPCNSTTEGCFYDSLNVSASGNGPTGLANGVGAFLDWNGIFMYFVSPADSPANSCNGSGPGSDSADAVYGHLALNTSANGLCWAGYHPMIEVQANTLPTYPWVITWPPDNYRGH